LCYELPPGFAGRFAQDCPVARFIYKEDGHIVKVKAFTNQGDHFTEYLLRVEN
jgi:hypothetical protein